MRARGLALLAAITLAALRPAAAGDFGRPDPSFLDGLIPKQFWKGPATGYSSYPLTDAENELRDRAYTLIHTREPRVDFDVWIARYRFVQVLPPTAANTDTTAYARNVLWMPGRSEASMYGQVIDDMTSDAQLIAPFVALACMIADLDGRRTRSLDYVTELSAADAQNALGRVNENRAVVAIVQRALHQRAGSYRYALERLVIAVPSRRAVEAERVLTRFDDAVLAADGALTQCGCGDVAVAAPVERPLVTK